MRIAGEKLTHWQCTRVCVSVGEHCCLALCRLYPATMSREHWSCYQYLNESVRLQIGIPTFLTSSTWPAQVVFMYQANKSNQKVFLLKTWKIYIIGTAKGALCSSAVILFMNFRENCLDLYYYSFFSLKEKGEIEVCHIFQIFLSFKHFLFLFFFFLSKLWLRLSEYRWKRTIPRVFLIKAVMLKTYGH